jgi:hypothetical protein
VNDDNNFPLNCLRLDVMGILPLLVEAIVSGLWKMVEQDSRWKIQKWRDRTDDNNNPLNCLESQIFGDFESTTFVNGSHHL